MKSFTITFLGREKLAIGIRSKFTQTVEAETIGEALVKLYETHDHITHVWVDDERCIVNITEKVVAQWKPNRAGLMR